MKLYINIYNGCYRINFCSIQSEEWQDLMEADEGYISLNAGLFKPSKGYVFDVQESITTWFATRMITDRQPANDVCFAEKTIPNRMDYLDWQLGK